MILHWTPAIQERSGLRASRVGRLHPRRAKMMRWGLRSEARVLPPRALREGRCMGSILWPRFHGVGGRRRGRAHAGAEEAAGRGRRGAAQAQWETVKPAAGREQQRWRRPLRRERPGRQRRPGLRPRPRGRCPGTRGGGPERTPGPGWPRPPPLRGAQVGDQSGAARGAPAAASKDALSQGGGAGAPPQAGKSGPGPTAAAGHGEDASGARSQSAGAAFLPSRGAGPRLPRRGLGQRFADGGRPAAVPCAPSPWRNCAGAGGWGETVQLSGPGWPRGWRPLQSRLSGRWDRRVASLRRAACEAVLCKEGARPGVPVIHSCLPLRGFICLGSANSALLGAGACQHDPSRRGFLLCSVPSVPPLSHHNLTFSSPRSSLQCPSCPRPRSTAWAGPESHLLTCSPE